MAVQHLEVLFYAKHGLQADADDRAASGQRYRNSKILIKYCILLFLLISEISVLTTLPSQGKYSNFLSGVFAFPCFETLSLNTCPHFLHKNIIHPEYFFSLL
jgi:hypothetical protein